MPRVLGVLFFFCWHWFILKSTVHTVGNHPRWCYYLVSDLKTSPVFTVVGLWTALWINHVSRDFWLVRRACLRFLTSPFAVSDRMREALDENYPISFSCWIKGPLSSPSLLTALCWDWGRRSNWRFLAISPHLIKYYNHRKMLWWIKCLWFLFCYIDKRFKNPPLQAASHKRPELSAEELKWAIIFTRGELLWCRNKQSSLVFIQKTRLKRTEETKRGINI